MLALYLTMIDDASDYEKFETIYNTYDMLLHTIGFKILKDRYLSEDAVQECYMKVIKNLKNIDDPISLKTKSFLSIIMKNTCLDIIKKQKRHPEEELEEAYPIAVKDEFNPKLDFEVMVGYIQSLPDIYKDVVFLKYNHDLSNAEIAQLLNVSVEVVKKRFQRVRDLLGDKID